MVRGTVSRKEIHFVNECPQNCRKLNVCVCVHEAFVNLSSGVRGQIKDTKTPSVEHQTTTMTGRGMCQFVRVYEFVGGESEMLK